MLPDPAQRMSEKGVVTQSWSPLGRGSDLLDSPVLAEIASTHGITAGQVATVAVIAPIGWSPATRTSRRFSIHDAMASSRSTSARSTW